MARLKLLGKLISKLIGRLVLKRTDVLEGTERKTPLRVMGGDRSSNSKFNSPLWKRVIAWERSRAASGYGIICGDADRNKQEEFSAECHSVDCF